MRLEELIGQLQTNSNAITAIEAEVNRLADFPSVSPLMELLNSPKPAVCIYLCRIIELRCKRKLEASSSMDEEVLFVIQLLQNNQSFHACNVYSLLGIYCWPIHFPSFFTDILNRLHTGAGYQILLLFLQKVNNSTEIDEKRRSELKKAVNILLPEILSGFRDEYASYIIQIYVEFLRMMPLTYDYSLVYRKASECPSEAIEFLSEAGTSADHNRTADILHELPASPAIIGIFCNSRIKSYAHPEKVYSYVFRCLGEDPDCFVPAVDFWQRIFSSPDKAAVLEPVLIAIIKAYLEIDENEREEVDGHVFGFFAIAARGYPEYCVSFLKKHESALPVKVVSCFLQKISKASTASLRGLTLDNQYLNAQTNFLRDDPNTPMLVPSLDFNDKDTVRLTVQILRKYNFSSSDLVAIMKMCDKSSCLNANEIRVECMLRLGIHDSFDGEWDMNKVIRFYYFLKHDRANYLKYAESFFNLFLLRAPFDRCFSILGKIGTLPPVILQKIYDNMDNYQYPELSCFNTDLLICLPFEQQKLFTRREVSRFISDWLTIKDHHEYYQAVKSLLNVFSAAAKEPDMIEMMLELVQLDYTVIVNRVLSIFTSYDGPYNVSKAVYLLISAYNTPSLSVSQPQLCTALTACMYAQDGPQAFSDVLSLPYDRCMETRLQISKTNKKAAQNIIRNFIKDFRGKPLRNLYENEVKVTKQNFITPEPRSSSESTEQPPLV